MRVFENRVLKRIFGPERDEVTGEWRRLHNEELYDSSAMKNIKPFGFLTPENGIDRLSRNVCKK